MERTEELISVCENTLDFPEAVSKILSCFFPQTNKGYNPVSAFSHIIIIIIIIIR